MIKNISRPVKSIIAAAGTVGILALGGALPAFAAADTGVTVSGGTLGGGALTFADFAGVSVTGAAQNTTSSWAIADVTDARGTGTGWKVTFAMTQLAEYATGAYVAGGHTLPAGDITITTASVVTAVSGSAASTVTPAPVNSVLNAAATPSVAGTPVKLLSAAVDGGMGHYSFTNLTATLAIPATVYAATYKSDATVSTNTAP